MINQMIIALIAILFNLEQVAAERKMVYIREVEHWSFPGLPREVRNVSITVIGPGRYEVKLIIEVFEDQKDMKYVRLYMDRCKSFAELNTCEQIFNLKIDRVCEKMKETNAIWAPILQDIHPPPTCAQKKGIYHIHIAPMDATAALKLYPGGLNYYFRLKTCIYTVENKRTLCIKGGGEIVVVKN